jgi:hypothetical protein
MQGIGAGVTWDAAATDSILGIICLPTISPSFPLEMSNLSAL